jgi:geranylgeranyl pyrophosphate synthase
LLNHQIHQINNRIETLWAKSGVGLDYQKALRLGLPNFNLTSNTNNSFANWMMLPNLCCQALGGAAEHVEFITAAWLLYYVGAHIMDSVEDADTPDDWWEMMGSGLAINVASGYYFTASSALQELYRIDKLRGCVHEIIADFNQCFLSMCEAQHGGLKQTINSLNQYWDNVYAKSGAFFALACRSGARAATDNSKKVDLFNQFGQSVGVLIQILDDLDDLHPQNKAEILRNPTRIFTTLPFLYTLEMTSGQEKNLLFTFRDSITFNEEMYSDVIEIMENSGAGIYVYAEIEKYRSNAVNALLNVAPESDFRNILYTNVSTLGK